MSAKPFNFSEYAKILEGNSLFSADELSRYQECNIPPLINQKCLSILIGVDHRLIYSLTNNKFHHYRQFSLKQKNGKLRKISAPRTYLKVVQWWILSNILENGICPDYVHGFVKNKSFWTNATFHEGSKHILNVDIKDFFPSISASDCKDVFLSMGFTGDVASQLADLCTFNDELPQGAPTSPMLANFVCGQLDSALSGLANEKGYKFSRYADDITFSTEGDEKISSAFLTQVTAIVLQHGFELNLKKTQYMGRGDCMEVTGLVVNEKAQMPRAWRKKVRAVYHQALRNPGMFKDKINEIYGYQGVLKSTGSSNGRLYRQGNDAIKSIEGASVKFSFFKLSFIKKIFRKRS